MKNKTKQKNFQKCLSLIGFFFLPHFLFGQMVEVDEAFDPALLRRELLLEQQIIIQLEKQNRDRAAELNFAPAKGFFLEVEGESSHFVLWPELHFPLGKKWRGVAALQFYHGTASTANTAGADSKVNASGFTFLPGALYLPSENARFYFGLYLPAADSNRSVSTMEEILARKEEQNISFSRYFSALARADLLWRRWQFSPSWQVKPSDREHPWQQAGLNIATGWKEWDGELGGESWQILGGRQNSLHGGAAWEKNNFRVAMRLWWFRRQFDPGYQGTFLLADNNAVETETRWKEWSIRIFAYDTGKPPAFSLSWWYERFQVSLSKSVPEPELPWRDDDWQIRLRGDFAFGR